MRKNDRLQGILFYEQATNIVTPVSQTHHDSMLVRPKARVKRISRYPKVDKTVSKNKKMTDLFGHLRKK